MAKEKKRLDQLVAELFPQYSRQYVQSLIMQGKVTVDGKIVTKPGTAVLVEALVEVDAQEPAYVSRAGNKLAHALDYFGIDPRDLVVLDAGLSTGGFTDCLLQRGVAKVYGIDVGYGQVSEKIRRDERVIIYERTNLRNLTSVGERVDLVTLDLSFISVLKVMEAVCQLAKDDATLIVLIKPQFEADRADVGRGGLIKDPAVHQRVIDRVKEGIAGYGFICMGITDSPILGTTGNKEFLGYFKRTKQS